ncbi:UNVERIFIED_CONTAM: hypothetical protein K2H54_070103 [Gekko kuhli]
MLSSYFPPTVSTHLHSKPPVPHRLGTQQREGGMRHLQKCCPGSNGGAFQKTDFSPNKDSHRTQFERVSDICLFHSSNPDSFLPLHQILPISGFYKTSSP